MQQHPFQIQQYQQQQQPTLMSLPAFQQVAQHTLDANQQAQLQQAINDQQQAQQQIHPSTDTFRIMST